MPDDGHQDAIPNADMALDPTSAAASSRPASDQHKRKASAAASTFTATQPSRQERSQPDIMINPPAMGVFARDSSKVIASGPGARPPIFSFEALAAPPSSLNRLPSLASTTADGPDVGVMGDGDDGQDDDQGTVDEDAGVIRCICGSDEDDGFTIQCDRCLVWQHCACFGMSQASVPDEYLCEQCSPRPVDVAFAQAIQQKRKNDEARKALLDRNLKRQTQSSNSAAAAFAAAQRQEVAVEPETAPQLDEPEPTAIQSTMQTLLPPGGTNGRSRKPSQALDLSNIQFVVPEVPASAQAGNAVGSGNGNGSVAGTANGSSGGHTRNSAKRKGQKGSRSRSGAPETPTVGTPTRGAMTPSLRDDRHDDPFDVADKLEAWHVEFTPIGKNLVAEPSILGSLAAAMLDWEDGSPLRALPGHAGKLVVPVQRAAVRRRMQSAAARAEETVVTVAEDDAAGERTATPQPSADPLADFDYAELGLAAVGNECMPIEMQGSSLADLASRTYVRHISESASAGVFSNVLQLTNPAEEPQRVWNASRSFSRPVMHGLFAEGPIPAGAFICEYRGELYNADTYRKDPINQYAALGAVKPHVHLFPPPLNLAVDARRFGNEGRFARFSCHPNAVLRPILFRHRGNGVHGGLGGLRSLDRSRSPTPSVVKSLTGFAATEQGSAPKNNDEPELLFGLFALTDIARTHEITLGWEWDDSHIVHFLPELVQNPFMEPREAQTPGGTPCSTFDAERHTANMVAIAERGEFPYAQTEFSAKMNSVATALLGCVLCACIGSAAAPGGGAGASANNARKQDCAVAQMLRVGNGMSLLNVVMPGKTNRRAKLPDFSPLVGVRRSWRPTSMPPTPDSSTKGGRSPAADADVDHQSVGHALEQLLSPDAATAASLVVAAANDEMPVACGQIDGAAFPDVTEDIDTDVVIEAEETDVDHDMEASAIEDGSVAEPIFEDDDDVQSDASSLTDPLSLASAAEDDSAEMDDPELRRALRLAGLRGGAADDTASQSGEESAVDSGIFVLPLKKRVNRTRIKATLSPSESECEVDDGTLARTDRADPAARIKAKAGQKRKAKAKSSRLSINALSDDDAEAPRPTKKRKKIGKDAIEPSSPLSSVPSPGSRYSSLSPPPPSIERNHDNGESSDEACETGSDASVSRGAASRRLASKMRAKTKSAVRTRPQRGASAKPEESALARKKKAKARLLRDSIADMGDTESSDDDDDRTKASNRTSSPASSPRDKAATPKRGSARPRMVASARAVPGPIKARKEATTDKPKKHRRVLSDSESESSDAAQTPRPPRAKTHDTLKPDPDASEPAPSDRLADALGSTSEPPSAVGAPVAPPARGSATPASAGEPAAADESAIGEVDGSSAAAQPAPAVEPVKEEPRVKLSLAEYKKRLAERRTSSQVAVAQASPPVTPVTPATPTSEAPTTLPAPSAEDQADAAAKGQARERLPDIPLKRAANSPAPTAVVDIARASHPTVAAATPKRPSTPPRSSFLSAVAAPTATRFVEIPKSPPAPAVAPQQQAQEPQSASSTDHQFVKLEGAGSLNGEPLPRLPPAALAPTDTTARTEAPPPPKTPPMKRPALPPSGQSSEASSAAVSAQPFGATANFAATGAPMLVSRLELERDGPPGGSEAGLDRRIRPGGFQPINARPATNSALGLSAGSGSAWSAAEGQRAGFVPIGSAKASSPPPTHHGGPVFGRPAMNSVGAAKGARLSMSGAAPPVNASPSATNNIPARSLSISSATSATSAGGSGGGGGGPPGRQLPPSPGFNPPRAPRAFLSTGALGASPGSGPAGSPPMSAVGANAGSPTAGTAQMMRPPPIMTGANAVSAVLPPAIATAPGPPSTRHATASMSPPSPALSLHSLRDFAGVPTGPASMRDRDGHKVEREWGERDSWSDPRLDRFDRERERDREMLQRDRDWEREPREPLPFRSGSFDEPMGDRFDHSGPPPPSFGGGGGPGRGGGGGGARGSGRGAYGPGGRGDVGRDHADDGPGSGNSHFHGPPIIRGGGFGGRGGGGGWGARARGRGGGRGRGGWGGPPLPPQSSLPPPR